jgi:N-methylhydantoinase B
LDHDQRIKRRAKRMGGKFDPIRLEILWRRLLAIVDEADATVARTAFSSLLRDAHDYTCMFTDRYGRELAQGTFCTPGQAGAMALGIKKIINMFPFESYRPGDVIIVNDPWLLAGHLNDICVLSPVFYRDELVAFTACVFHHSDVGGRVSSDNREVFEEGLFLPPVKLYEEGKLNEAVLEIIRWNVRTPDSVIGDIRSQVAANHVCARKLIEMLEEEGLRDLDDLAEEIIERSERSMRAGISNIPEGVYPFETVIEGPPGKDDVLVKLSVKVKDGEVEVDFTGTSPQVDWGGNVVYNFTYAYCFMAIKSAVDPEIPVNEGSTRPIKVTAPEGSVVNCKFPAAVAARMQIGHFMAELVFRALAPAIPDRVIAPCGGTPAHTYIFYGQRHDGSPWLTNVIGGGGMGASSKNDGHHCAIFPANGANTPVEIFESDTPLLVLERNLIPDSGGAGKMRGGLGRTFVVKVPDDQFAPKPPVVIAIQGGRFKYPAEGLFGGKPGAKSKFLVNGEPGDPSTLTFCKPGDIIEFHAPGGGGFGDPLERDPEMVKRDVLYGYVSLEKAQEEYGVVIDPHTYEVDWEKTEKLREKLKMKRTL